MAEAELRTFTCRDMLRHTSGLARPPYLTVIARLATNQLWLEVLDTGGVDLFAKAALGSDLRRTVETSLMDRIHLC